MGRIKMMQAVIRIYDGERRKAREVALQALYEIDVVGPCSGQRN